jgi:hypothetical protein
MRRSGLLAVVLSIALVAGCGHHTGKYARPGDNPHDTDSLYHLLRLALTDSNPYPIMKQVDCVTARLVERFGEDEGLRRFRAVMDTFARTREDRRRWAIVDREMALHDFPVDDETCGPGLQFHYHPDTARDPTHPPHDSSR